MRRYIKSELSNLFEPNVYITMVAKIEGAITKEEMKNAVMTAYQSNEATMSKVDLNDRGAAFYEKMEQTGCKFIVEAHDINQIILENERKLFAIYEGEMIRTFFIPKEKEATLLVMAHHLVGDGKAIIIFLDQVMRILAGEQVSYQPMILLEEKELSKRASLSFKMKMAVRLIHHRWKNDVHFTWEDYRKVHEKYWTNQQSDIMITTYSADELEQMKKACTNGITLNSYLITRLLKEHPECSYAGIPVSVRESNTTMSNQTSGINISYAYQENKTFEENLKIVHSKIHKILKDKKQRYFVLLFFSKVPTSLMEAILLTTHGCYEDKMAKRLANIIGYLGDKGTDLGVSNLTRVEDFCENERFRVTELTFIPPKVSYSKQIIGIVTYKDQLTISYHKMRKLC